LHRTTYFNFKYQFNGFIYRFFSNFETQNISYRRNGDITNLKKMKKLLFPLMILLIAMGSCKSGGQLTGNEDEYELLKKGYNRISVKDYKGGIQIFTKITEMNPDNAEAVAYRGLCKYHLKDFEGAIRDYNRALEIQPGYAEVYDLRGIAKGELGDKEGACADWKKAFELGLKGAFDLIKEFCWDEQIEN